MIKSPQFLNTEEAAKFIGVTGPTLVTWRCTRRYAIPYFKVGGKVRYDIDDLAAWLQSRKVETANI